MPVRTRVYTHVYSHVCTHIGESLCTQLNSIGIQTHESCPPISFIQLYAWCHLFAHAHATYLAYARNACVLCMPSTRRHTIQSPEPRRSFFFQRASVLSICVMPRVAARCCTVLTFALLPSVAIARFATEWCTLPHLPSVCPAADSQGH